MPITKEEIIAKCSAELIASRDEAAIANVVSVGRIRPSNVEIGNGTILDLLGLTVGNALLDAVNASTSLRYAKTLLDSGRLNVGSNLVQTTIKSLVPAILTQEQSDILCALGVESDVVSAIDVAYAMEGM